MTTRQELVVNVSTMRPLTGVPTRYRVGQRNMSLAPAPARRHPFAWVPTLYFAEGLPFYAVYAIAPILYKRLGLPNDTITVYTSLLLWAWTVKPLWSPLLERSPSKKPLVVALQVAAGVLIGAVGLSLSLPNYFPI